MLIFIKQSSIGNTGHVIEMNVIQDRKKKHKKLNAGPLDKLLIQHNWWMFKFAENDLIVLGRESIAKYVVNLASVWKRNDMSIRKSRRKCVSRHYGISWFRQLMLWKHEDPTLLEIRGIESFKLITLQFNVIHDWTPKNRKLF